MNDTVLNNTVLNNTVLISGASIAGPTLAYWLNRCGFRPTVVEKAGTVRPGGYPIDLRGVAIEVIDRMGLRAGPCRSHRHEASDAGRFSRPNDGPSGFESLGEPATTWNCHAASCPPYCTMPPAATWSTCSTIDQQSGRDR